MRTEFKKKALTQLTSLMSITLVAAYAITSIIMVALKQYTNRGYLFGIVIWCFVVGLLQSGYMLYSIIMHFKRKQPFYYLLTINTLASTILSITLLFIEYFIFDVWYKYASMNSSWNGAITYALYGIVIALFLWNCFSTGFVLYKTYSIYDLEEDIDEEPNDEGTLDSE